MGIKMNELSAETQMKFKMATADGKLTTEEWKQFSESEQQQLSAGLGGKTPTEDNPLKVQITTTKPVTQPTKHEEVKKEKSNWFSDWLNDKDKVCTDGKDDGSLSFGEAAESFGKGLLGLVKGAINHPIATAATIGIGALATVATGGAALPVMIALGAGTGAVMIGKGAYDAATAETDAEAKAAWEGIGNGTFALAASALGAKSSLNAASKAGVTGAEGAKELNTAQALVRNFKVIPKALKVSGQNIKGNVLTWTTGNIHAHSNKLQGAESYMSKANDVQAYRFNPNGTPEEILANNPGVFRGADGKYYLPNKWSPNEPYLIDPSKEQMIMMYGGDDMAVCDGAIFKGSYVDTEGFHANQAMNYQDPSKLAYGEVVNVTKQAPGAFKVMPEGTKIQTLEGLRTVGEGEVVALDHAGNPYVTTPANILKRNVGLSDNAMVTLYKMDPAAVEKNNLSWIKDNNYNLYRQITKQQEKAAFIQKWLEEIPQHLREQAKELLESKLYKYESDAFGKFNYPCHQELGDSKNAFLVDLLKKQGIDVKISNWIEYGYYNDYSTATELLVNGKEVAISEFPNYAISLLSK